MFLDYLKSFVIKKTISKSLSADIVKTALRKINTVGIVIDHTYIKNNSKLKQNLIAYGIKEENIEIIVRTSQTKNEQVSTYSTFNASTVTWTGAFSDDIIQKFVEKEFDLLINYYDQQKLVLMLVSAVSRAHFKVGFSAIDKSINDLIIDASAAEYSIFDQELFKYLKILNTI